MIPECPPVTDAVVVQMEALEARGDSPELVRWVEETAIRCRAWNRLAEDG